MQLKLNGLPVNIRGRIANVWSDIVSSLWFIPSLIVAGMAGLAIVMVGVDRILWDRGVFENGAGVFRGGVDGSRGVLTAVAGSVIGAAATVFSITVVVLQLASSQFTPRVVKNFTADRRFQVTLGLLLGVFAYSLIVLWAVGRERNGAEPFIPSLSVALGMVLAMISVGMLILFIDRVASLIQVADLIERVTHETIEQVVAVYPDQSELGSAAASSIDVELTESAAIRSDFSGYIRFIDHELLLEEAGARDCTISVNKHVGDFVLPATIIARVKPVSEAHDALVSAIRGAFICGPDRTIENDVELGIQRIADVGIRTLSPGVNDPTTAMNCIDRLCEVLYEVASRSPSPKIRYGEKGGVLLFNDSRDFVDLVEQAFSQIRHFGAADVAVSSRLAIRIGELCETVAAPYREALIQQARLIATSCKAAGMIPEDLRRVERRLEWIPSC